MAARKKQLNINLIIKEDIDWSFSGQLLSWSFTYGRYIIIITQIIVLSVFFLRFRLDRDHIDLKEAVSQKQALLVSVGDLEDEIRRIQKNLAHIKQTTSQQQVPLNILRFFQDNTPSDTTFQSLTINGNEITFNASTGSLRSFNYFLKKLQNQEKFKEVTLEQIQRKNDGSIDFTLSVVINPPSFAEYTLPDEKNSEI